MKILKIIGLIVLFLIGIFVVMGLIKPEVSISNSYEIDRPVDEAWKIFHKEELMTDWIVGLKKMEKISGENNAIGSKYKLSFEHEGEPFEMTETITDWKKNQVFRFDIESEFWNGDNKVEFAANGDKTVITHGMKGKGNGIMMGAMAPFMKSGMEEMYDLQYTKLKEVIESYKFPEPEPMLAQDSVGGM